MPRKPLASKVKEASGAYNKNPQRRNRLEPIPQRGWPSIPDSIAENPIALERWNHVCKELDSQNILTTADHYVLESYCKNYATWFALQEQVGKEFFDICKNGNRRVKPELKLLLDIQAQMLRQIIELGLTPSARSRLHVINPEKNDPFEEWLRS